VTHKQFQDRLNRLVTASKVGQEVFGEVLARTAREAPDDTTRQRIGEANPEARRPLDRRQISQATVSKAVKALLQEGLLDETRSSSSPIRNEDGRRPLSALRLGRRFVVAGVDVQLKKKAPKYVTTALIGLDSTRVLRADRAEVVSNKGGDRWEDAAQLVCSQVEALLGELNEARQLVDDRATDFEIFGIGIEIGAPVNNGKVMVEHGGKEPIDFKSILREVLAERGHDTVPVLVENDVNALAVLAAREAHYTHPDLVVVSVFEEGVGGGLVMDGRLRRGGNGRAMEIGHMPVSVPYQKTNPFQDRTQPSETDRCVPTGLQGFEETCWCGGRLHVDTFAPPSRIRDELKIQVAGVAYRKAVDSPTMDPSDATTITDEGKIFQRAGSALGRAAAHVCNIVNPSSLIIYLPPELNKPDDETAARKFESTGAGAYYEAAWSEITSAFANKDQQPKDYLKFLSLPDDPKEVAVLGARAAAACVFDSFIEHALKTDGCEFDGRN